MLAKEALTLDHVTGGRFILGLGAGWHVGEHESFGIDLPPLRERFDRYESAVRLLKALFSDERGMRPGCRFTRLHGASSRPRWSLASSDRVVRPCGSVARGRAGCASRPATRTAGNYASNLDGTLEGFMARLDALRSACEEIGRDPTELTISVQIIIPSDVAGRRTATERAIAYGRAGSDEILLTTPAREGAAGIRRLVIEVAAPLRDAFG